MKCLYAGISRRNRRPTNQDGVFLGTAIIAGKPAVMAVVCDGVGGLSDGGFASAQVTGMLRAWFNRNAGSDPSAVVPGLLAETDTINRHIYEKACQAGMRTGSTMSALLLFDGYYHIVHTGDSRIYRVSESGAPLQLTPDHTAGADDPKPGALTACMGSFEQVTPFYVRDTLEKGMLFLLCTDGFYRKFDFSRWPAMAPRAHSQAAFAQSLEKMADYVIGMGENDNISLAAVKVTRR